MGSSRVAHYTLPDVGLILHTTYYILHATCYILHTTYYMLHTTYYILHTTCYILHATYYILHTTTAYYVVLHTAYCILPRDAFQYAQATSGTAGAAAPFLKRIERRVNQRAAAIQLLNLGEATFGWVSGNQWQSVVISGDQWQSVVISGNRW